MKKIIKILTLSITIAITFNFIACDGGGGDDPIIPTDKRPGLAVTASFNGDATEMWRNEQANFNVTATSNSTTSASLSNLKVEITFNSTGNTEEDTAFTINAKSFTETYGYTVPGDIADGEIITIKFILKDADNEVKNKTFTLNCTDPADVIKYEFRLGAQSNGTDGNFFNTTLGEIYFIDVAQDHKSEIDFVYMYVVSPYNYTASLVSPSNAELFGVGPGQNKDYKIHEWDASVRNETIFKKLPDGSVSLDAFDEMRASNIESKYKNASTSELDIAKNLHDATGGFTAPAMYVFKTRKGKYGIVYVEEIKIYAKTGTIDLVLKISK